LLLRAQAANARTMGVNYKPPLKCLKLRAPNGEEEWTCVELQGVIEPRTSGVSLDGVEFGRLEHDGDGSSGDCTLVVGKQQLKGRIIKLKKPLAVMTLEEDGKEYHVQGVVRQKFVFTKRPEPALVPQVASPAARSATAAAAEGSPGTPSIAAGPSKRAKADPDGGAPMES